MRLRILFFGIIFLLIPLNAFSIEITITATVPSPSQLPGGGVPAPPPAPTRVIFEGRAYPEAFLTLLKDGKVAATFFAESSGLFKKELTGIPEGTYTFGIWAEDTEGRKSVTQSFTIGLIRGTTTTISGVFIPPTIYLAPTQVERGGKVDISGQSFPGSQIKIFVSSSEIVKDTKASPKGKWAYKLDTSPIEEGEHKAKAKALWADGEQTQFSQTLSFLVLKPGALAYKGADLNFDGKVNIIDFSILLYFWGQRKPVNICADINQDGIVNIVDFSIMMYWWG
ncbi:hypothetical protein KKA69_01275 [Patescibacteria group bacterium]|nr:hypothetical protein [Patescibacteria group bacterium]